jgi:transposase-like protein
MKTKTLKQDKRGRVLRSAEDRQKLVEWYERSGLSKVDFCRQHGIKVTTLYGWVSEYGKVRRRGMRTSGPVKFAGVNVALGKTAPIEIELPSRIYIRLQEAGVVGDLVKFVREVGSC